MSETQTQQSGNFINLFTQGIGYLSRIRTVTPKRSKDSFLACTINAMHGNKDVKNGIQYVKFDVRVCGLEAIEAINTLADIVNDPDQKMGPILVGFRIGDCYIDTFEYTKGEKAGQTGAVLKGRLIKLHWAIAGGEKIFGNAASADADADAVDMDH